MNETKENSSLKPAPVLAIVSPCYNEEESLPGSFVLFRTLFSTLIQEGAISEKSFLCLVDDGSRDGTWEVMKRESEKDPDFVKVVKLSRNFGHQSAILSGMETVREHCDACVTVDVDLQDDQWQIREMVRKYREENTDIVLGVKRQRKSDSFFKKLTAKSFYKIMQLLGAEVVEDHADFRFLSRAALDQLALYSEYNMFLRGIVIQMGLKTDYVFYDIKPRQAGETKYTFLKMFNLAVSGITSFSILPLRFLFLMGFVFLFVSILMSCQILFDHFTGRTVSGWTTLAISIWGLSGIQLMSLGIVGEYVGRIFLESKRRPRYHIEYDNVNRY